MSKQISLTIDGIKVSVPEDNNIMQAADSLGIKVPRLCWHSKLSLFGGCRLCVVEVEGSKSYPPSCVTPVKDGMVVRTNCPGVRRARKNILRLIMANHPSNCQICSKNGACELQVLAESLGLRDIVFSGRQKHFPKDETSPSVVRDSDKCVLCGRCVRVCAEVQGVSALAFMDRGFNTNVAPAYALGLADSVCINCGQCVNVCPTGALVEKDSTADVWQALSDKDKIPVVQIAPAVRVAIGEEFGNPAGRDMTSQTVQALRLLGFATVFDTQFTADLTIVEEGNELIRRVKGGGKLPMITSCSPGWIKFCETFYPELLPNLSTCKSPQQMMGALIKTYYARKAGLDPAKIFSVSVMPCTAKKFEAARPEMNCYGHRDVDAVLTTRELARMIKQAGIDFNALSGQEFDSPLGESSGAAPIFGATGGVMEAALRTAYEVITGRVLGQIEFAAVRGLDGIKEAEVDIDGLRVKVAVANTLVNAHRLFTEIKQGKRQYHFIEIMACPGGCLGGGGQPYLACAGAESLATEVYQKRAQGLYSIDERKTIRKAHLNPDVQRLYAEFLKEPLGELSHKLLHTRYHKRPAGVGAPYHKAVELFKGGT